MSARERTVPSSAEQERRRQALRDALAQVRLEGMEPDPAFFAYGERYVHGEITLDEAIAEYLAHVAASADAAARATR